MASKCPFCGAPLDWEQRLASVGRKNGADPSWPPWEKRRFSILGIGDVSAIPAGVEYERKRPIRDPTVEADVVTPVLQTAFTGAVGAVVSGAVALAAGWARPWAFALGGGALALSVTWAALLADHRALLWEVEKVSGVDIDGDGVTGEPVAVDVEPETRAVRVEITENRSAGRKRIRYVDVPLSDSELEAVARAVMVRNERFSRNGLGDILSQNDYAEMYQAMLDGGLIETTGNRNDLTAAGRAFLRQYLPGWQEHQSQFLGRR